MGSEGGIADRQPEPGPPSRLRPLRLTSDPELVALARSGSDDAFGELARRHRAALTQRCTRLVGRDHAEDAVQQAFLKALLAVRGDAAPPAEIRPWLHRVAHNVAVDLLRRRALESGSPPLEEELAGAGEPPIDVLERCRELRSIVREIGRLPERQRQALVLRAVEGHGYEEIAEALDASEGMVRQLIYRARERVRAGAAAALCPPWLLRLLHRGAAHPAQGAAAGGALAGGGALKVGAVVTTAALALGGATIVQSGRAGGAEPAHAAAPAPKVAKHVAVVDSLHPNRHRHLGQVAHRHARVNVRATTRPHGTVRSVAVGGGAGAVPSLPVAPPPSRQSPPGGHRPSHASSPPPASHAVETGPAGAPPPATIPASTATSSPPPQTSPGPPPPAAHEPARPAGTPAPAVTGHVTSYEQSPGFGGPLTIARTNGEQVGAYFGELVTLGCYFVRDGRAVAHSACTKERLQPGTPVVLAEHAVNGSGHDVWTHVELIVPAP
jgi:RNA polymerase sigma-70 factor (ECF subfamily)